LVVSQWLWQQNPCRNKTAKAPNSHDNQPMTAPNNHGNNCKEKMATAMQQPWQWSDGDSTATKKQMTAATQ